MIQDLKAANEQRAVDILTERYLIRLPAGYRVVLKSHRREHDGSFPWSTGRVER